jgi:alkylation response protein AidB-like acyl-CoA dehydrogenase
VDFDFAPREHAFRLEVRAWLARHRPADLVGRTFSGSRPDRTRLAAHRHWQRRLYEAGYVGMDWPVAFGGRGASLVDQIIFYEELARAQAPPPINRGGLSMLGPTLMAHGTEAQQRRFLPGILTAEEIWCQGFSEPNAGSDLASVRTRAERDGDAFRVTGQKVWTSLAHLADWGFFLVRTDPGAVRHRGLTLLLIDMRSPGVSVRPLRQLTGEAEFNEVFLDGVRVPAEQVVGEVDGGWEVAMTALGYERDVLTFVRAISLQDALARLLALAGGRRPDGGRPADDPLVRQRVAAVAIQARCLQLTGYRSLTRILRGQRPGPEGSTAKLVWSEVDQALAETASQLLGPAGQLLAGSPRAPDDGQWALYLLVARASGIRAGTSEILKNILGERVLGLPKD